MKKHQVQNLRDRALSGLLKFALVPLVLAVSPVVSAQILEWSPLPALPDPEGFAAMFAGVSHEMLLVAGGANFPDKRPWEGGTKTWYDDVWALDKPDGAWRKVGKLPKPLGYGVTVTWRDEVVCVGGSNATGHHTDVFSLKLEGDKLVVKNYPHLPKPCANSCGLLVGDVIYMAGGIEKPDATQAMHTFWALNLSDEKPHWRTLEPWPGKERMLSVSAGCEGNFYLLTGAALHPGPDGKPEREWLKDAYRYREGRGWEKLPDTPRVAVAAVSPAPSLGCMVFLIAGDDGSKVGFKPEEQHPGFPRDAFAFDSAAQTWNTVPGETPFSRATVPMTPWQGGFVIPSGEARPGYRTNEVWMLRMGK